ncbi:MAG TPA: transcriptional regulator, partial [Alcaligenes faecalis]|nr:transcriptional regulator [Alcaligenes faecalis]
AMHTLEATKQRKTLTISTVPSFAASWLIPRLADFKQRHPDIEIRVEASPTLVDLRRDKVDIAIRHGLGVYPGLQAEPLMAPVLLPVASPALLQDKPTIQEPAD